MKSRIATVVLGLAIILSAFGATAGSASAADTPSGTAGGGNCSVWASIKEAMFGVHCGFYMTP